MLGKVFALCNDTEQAQFLNTVGRCLKRVCIEGSLDMQIFRIVGLLDEDGRDFIKRLYQCIESDEG